MPQDTDPGSVPPELAWIDVDQIDVDDTYQRSIESARSKTLIGRMVIDFDWRLFQVVTVARSGKRFVVIDGQHRVEAARRKKIDKVPAIIVDAPDAATQAMLFANANRRRVTVTSLALHHALVGAGDETACAVQAALDKARVIVPRYPIPSNLIKPRHTLAIASVRICVSVYGIDMTADALKLVAEFWGDPPGEIRADRIRGVCKAIAQFGARRVKQVIAGMGPGALDEAAEDFKDYRGGTKISGYIGIITGHAQGHDPLAGVVRDAPQRAPLDDAPPPLAHAVNRRCASCESLFQTRDVTQLWCESCRGAKRAA